MGFQTRVVGNCLSQTKQSCAPQTTHHNFIFIGLIEQESQPRLCRQARICMRTYPLTYFSFVTSLSNKVNNVMLAVGLRGETPPSFAAEKWRVCSPAAWWPQQV